MEPIVTTTAGTVRGAADDGALAFLGVPFAAPPFGLNRLLAPAPPEPWDGVRDALAYGPTAQQPADETVGGIPEPCIPGEDILTVNVFTPDLGGANLPVLVWIHGGGFVAGSSASPWYRGTRFARDGIVVASIGYRLGAEGFLPLAGAPANRAVLDWIAALEWVQQNIAAFGGDPAKVTIGGQSAGGAACTTLLAAPAAQGLFHRAISMSGVARAASMEEASANARTIADHLGVEPTRDAIAALPFEKLHDAQRSARPAGLNASMLEDGRAMSGGMPFAPIVDGELLHDKPIKVIAGGSGGDVALIAGTTADEFVFPVAVGAATIREDQVLRAIAGLGFEPEAYRAHHADDEPSVLLGRALTDQMFRSRCTNLLEARVGAGGSAPTFAYEFRWPSQILDGKVGSVHCIDIPYAFDNLDAPDVAGSSGDDPPQSLATAMHDAFVGFIAVGDPGNRSHPWPPYDLTDRATMLFDDPTTLANDPLATERKLWARPGA